MGELQPQPAQPTLDPGLQPRQWSASRLGAFTAVATLAAGIASPGAAAHESASLPTEAAQGEALWVQPGVSQLWDHSRPLDSSQPHTSRPINCERAYREDLKLEQNKGYRHSGETYHYIGRATLRDGETVKNVCLPDGSPAKLMTRDCARPQSEKLTVDRRFPTACLEIRKTLQRNRQHYKHLRPQTKGRTRS